MNEHCCPLGILVLHHPLNDEEDGCLDDGQFGSSQEGGIVVHEESVKTDTPVLLLLLVKDRTEVLDSILIPLQLASGQLCNVFAAGLLSQCTVELLAGEEEQEKRVQALL